jgi:hypothetical protein
MGFLDKVKEQAAVATAAAKDAAQKGQAKIDDLQAKRAADALLRDLGAAVYAQRTGRAGAGADGEVTRLVGELEQHEAAHGPLILGAGVSGNGSPAPDSGPTS